MKNSKDGSSEEKLPVNITYSQLFTDETFIANCAPEQRVPPIKPFNENFSLAEEEPEQGITVIPRFAFELSELEAVAMILPEYPDDDFCSNNNQNETSLAVEDIKDKIEASNKLTNEKIENKVEESNKLTKEKIEKVENKVEESNKLTSEKIEEFKKMVEEIKRFIEKTRKASNYKKRSREEEDEEERPTKKIKE